MFIMGSKNSLGYTEKSGKKFFMDFHLFLEKVIYVFSVYVRIRNVNLKNLPTSMALRLLPKSISLTSKVFSALFWHRKLKIISMLMFSIWGPYSPFALQTCN